MNTNTENTKQVAGMKWVRQKSTLHVADGKAGTFYIQESRSGGRRRFWPRYVSKTGGKSFHLRPSSTLFLAKLSVEENYYWEDGDDSSEEKKAEAKHAQAPRKEVKRWDMKY